MSVEAEPHVAFYRGYRIALTGFANCYRLDISPASNDLPILRWHSTLTSSTHAGGMEEAKRRIDCVLRL